LGEGEEGEKEGSGEMRTYEQDYAGWAEDTAHAIAEGRWDDIDRNALADEVLDLGKSNRREIESALRVILIHLLKMAYQPLKQTRSWDLTVEEHRLRLNDFFAESPSLWAQRDALAAKAYPQARLRAANETGLPVETFPVVCEWTFASILGAKKAAGKKTRK
jgi:Domain of unknown function DUF29